MLDLSIEESIKEEVTEILLSLGIPVNLQGFGFLKDSIVIATQRPEIMRKVTKELYPAVARRYDVSVARVERAIRHAILVSFNKDKITTLNTVFNLNIFSNLDKPTNSELIALIADRMITKYKLNTQRLQA